MLRFFVFAITVSAVFSADACGFPNGTATALNWWPCDDTSVIEVYNVTVWDPQGNPEYPIHLSEKMIVKVDILNPDYVRDTPYLMGTINLWMYATSFTGACTWNPVPTFGLLTNKDACENGVPCPVQIGRQWLDITIDFSMYQPILNVLKDDMPYQIQLLLTDTLHNQGFCAYAQARALLK